MDKIKILKWDTDSPGSKKFVGEEHTVILETPKGYFDISIDHDGNLQILGGSAMEIVLHVSNNISLRLRE